MQNKQKIVIERKTKETAISATFGIGQDINIETDAPFLSHMLHSFAFHGGFSLELVAKGDVEVDPHHLVEDTGIVLGSCIQAFVQQNKQLHRFGWAIVPMDDALCQVSLDLSNRPYCVFNVNFTSDIHAGNFPLLLLREFFIGMSNSAAMNLHLNSLHGQNGHHIAEALFKATALALSMALGPGKKDIPSTKGLI